MSLHTTARDQAATARAERTAAFEAREAASRHHQLQQQRAQVVATSAAFEERVAGKTPGMAEIQERRRYAAELETIDAELAELES